MVRVTLYEQLGGEAGIATVVEDFYARLVADDLLAPWFEGADDDRIRFHLRAYLAVALGGPEGYTGRSMRQAHAGLKITGTAFATALDRLADSLRAAGAEEASVTRVVAIVGSLKPVVVQVPLG
ncbi:MAG: group 1 hemoglobin [Microbacteriaceae bacterium]|jgi:hemoglobin|nr:group 1 hemoglobin [Microbacteriaceae bacterium]